MLRLAAMRALSINVSVVVVRPQVFPALYKLSFVSPDRTYSNEAGDHRAARTPPCEGPTEPQSTTCTAVEYLKFQSLYLTKTC